MFQFPTSPLITLLFHVMIPVLLLQVSSLIRISKALWLFAPPLSFSQLVTSFIGSWYLGILPMLLLAWSFLPTILISGSSSLTIFVLPKSHLYLTYRYLLPLLLSIFVVIFILHYIVFNVQYFSHEIIFFNLMVEIKRFELLTPCLQGRCSPNWAIPPSLLQSSLHGLWKLNSIKCTLIPSLVSLIYYYLSIIARPRSFLYLFGILSP